MRYGIYFSCLCCLCGLTSCGQPQSTTTTKSETVVEASPTPSPTPVVQSKTTVEKSETAK